MSKQLFAKVGAFVLIAANLGAYYVFWPDSATRGPADPSKTAAGAPTTDKQDNLGKSPQIAPAAGAAQPGEVVKPSLLQGDGVRTTIPPPVPLSTKPEPLPPALVGASMPAAIELPAIPKLPDPDLPIAPASTQTQAKSVDPTIAQLQRLKASFGKETDAKPAAPEPFTTPAKDTLNLKPVPVSAVNIPAKPGQDAVSPWSVQMEIAGTQKVLTARLDKRTEFRVACDQVEMKTLDGAVVAMGKVRLTGPGLTGSCQRLTIWLHTDTMALDGSVEVQVQQGGAGATAELKGEQLALRLRQPSAGLPPVDAFPTATNPTAPVPEPFSIPRPLVPEKKAP